MPLKTNCSEPLRLPVVSKPLTREEPAQNTVHLAKKCGSGAFGDVYVGTVNVAVKVVDRSAKDQRELAEALDLEAWALKQCKKANVPHVIGFIDYNASLVGHNNQRGQLVGVKHEVASKKAHKYDALVMEFATGGSLEDKLKKGPLNESECKKLAKALLETLDGLHEDAHIIHRDLKPGNVMFEGGEVKLIDFGVCSDKDRPSTPIGTPYYLAPEIWNASPKTPYSNKVDLWSLGALLYHAAVGFVPFDGKSMQDLQRRVNYHLQAPERLYFPRSMNQDMREFISALLSPAKTRPSALKALSHPWLVGRPVEQVKVKRDIVYLPPIKAPSQAKAVPTRT